MVSLLRLLVFLLLIETRWGAPHLTLGPVTEPFADQSEVSTEAKSSVKDLLTLAVIRKAAISIRLDPNRGIRSVVTYTLAKWGANIVINRDLLDSISQRSPNPTETILLLLASHNTLSVRWEFLEPILLGSGRWLFENDSKRLCVVRKCHPEDLAVHFP
jgi:hypothetical protein